LITISLCMIVRNEENTIARCLDSVSDLVDEINIVDTGSTDRTKEVVLAYTDRIFDFEWIDDFAVARNFSFDHATKDYILWLDADDYLLQKDRDALRKLKETLDPFYDSVIMDYAVSRDAYGNTLLFTKRNRLVKRTKEFRWAYPVHEVLIVGDVNILVTDIEITHGPNREHKDPKRNLKIIEKYSAPEHNIEDSRYHFYYANELMDTGQLEEAITLYESFLLRDEAYFEDQVTACSYLAHCYRMKDEHKRELQYLFRTFEFDLPRADYCCRIGFWYQEHQDYEKAVYWYETALRHEIPTHVFGLMNKSCWTWAPHVHLMICYGKLALLDKAYEHNLKALDYLQGDVNLLQNKKQLEEAIGKHDENEHHSSDL
jgi:glycosyltransferase involved in cell wall biosynthesis